MYTTMKIRISIIGIFFLLYTTSGFSQEWSQSESFNTLAVEQSFTGLTQLHASGERVFTAAFKADFNYALHYSDDNGISWSEATSDNTTGSYAVFANVNADTIYSYGSDLFGTRYLRKSTDAGATWTVQVADYSNFPFFFIPTQFAAVNDTLILTSTARDVGLLKSIDGGATWESFITFDDNDNNKAIASVKSDASHFYLAASSNGKGVFRSHRDSTRWIKVFSVDEINGSILDLEVNENGRVFVLTNDGIDYSDDQGETWNSRSRSDLGLGNSGTLTAILLKGEHVILTVSDATNGSKVYEISTQLDASTNITAGLTDYEQGSLIQFYVANSTSIFAKRNGQDTALWQYPEPGGTVSVEKEERPEAFSLSQNYPNPFNPSTTISFSIPEVSDVSLKVFNMLGQKVATLYDGQMNSGDHSISFFAKGLPSGMYLYRLQAGGYSQIKKMQLVK